MHATWVIAALAAAAELPDVPPPVPVHRVPADSFFIPFNLDAAGVRPELVASVELMWSADRGRTWQPGGTAPPSDRGFTFRAKEPGEYWFAVRLHPKAGPAVPPQDTDLRPVLKVAVAPAEPVPLDPAAMQRAARLARLAEDIDRVELELIRGDLGRLEKADGFAPETAAAFDLLYDRLHRLAAGPVAAAAARAEAELARLEVELIAKEVERLGKLKALTPEAVERLDRLRARLREVGLRGRFAEPAADGPWAPTERRLIGPSAPSPAPQPLPPPQLFPKP
jgi:hypothetical protein